MQATAGSTTSSKYQQCEQWIQDRLQHRAQNLRPGDAAFADKCVKIHQAYVSLVLEGCSGEAGNDPQAIAEAAHEVSVAYEHSNCTTSWT